jgi:hypothetical protein
MNPEVVLPICPLTLRALKLKAAGYPHDPKSLGEHIRKRRNGPWALSA